MTSLRYNLGLIVNTKLSTKLCIVEMANINNC